MSAAVEGIEREIAGLAERRAGITAKIDTLREEEPWPGYDEQGPEEVERRLAGADADTAARVRDYERRHKARQAVIAATGALAGSG